MSNDQQIDKLKGHVLIFSDEFRNLILGFEMLVPVAEHQEVLKRFSGTKRANGLEIVRWSLIQECIIGITKLAYDAEPQNPTAGRLIGTILSLPSSTLNKLKGTFSVPIKAVLASDRPPTEADLRAGPRKKRKWRNSLKARRNEESRLFNYGEALACSNMIRSAL